MAHFFITGAGGYIGATLVELALADGHRVTAMDRFFFGEDLLGDFAGRNNFGTVKKDIRDINAADLEGVDVVMDLAALSNDPAGELNPELTAAINHRGRVHVAETAKAAGVPRYLLASSCSVYGFGETEMLDEASPTDPLTEYARSTLEAERHVLGLASDRFCVAATRNATVFGLARRMRFDLVVNLMTKNAVETGKIFVTGGGHQWRPLVHVRDVARAFLELAASDANAINGEAFNIGLDNYQIRGLAFAVRENLPFPVTVDIQPDAADKRSYNVSFEKAKRVFGYEAKLDVGFAVREIYDAIKEGSVDVGERTVTVEWYRHLLEAEQLVDEMRLNGRML